jgi:hypothetical protein
MRSALMCEGRVGGLPHTHNNNHHTQVRRRDRGGKGGHDDNDFGHRGVRSADVRVAGEAVRTEVCPPCRPHVPRA